MDMVGSGDSCSEDVKLSTQSGTTSIEQTVSSVLGSRFLSGLSRISIDLTSALLGSDTNPGVWRVEGLISKAPALTTKGGSTARESQFFTRVLLAFYINRATLHPAFVSMNRKTRGAPDQV